MQSIDKARELLRHGVKVKYVAKIVGLTPAICQQLKRELNTHIDFGCVVCSSKKTATKMFCAKHYQKYVAYPKIKKY
jgi:hypothetical protein